MAYSTPLAEAQRLLNQRHARERHFPGLGDAAFTMLLQLAASREKSRAEHVTSLCIASYRPATTALRHLGVLRDLALIERFAHPHDGRIEVVALTAKGVAALRSFFVEITPASPAGRGPAHGFNAGAGPIGFAHSHSERLPDA